MAVRQLRLEALHEGAVVIDVAPALHGFIPRGYSGERIQ